MPEPLAWWVPADPHQPLRLYRFDDAPPELRTLADPAAGTVLIAVVPAVWLEEAWLTQVPFCLWLLVAGTPRSPQSWGRLTRVAQDDGSLVVLVARP